MTDTFITPRCTHLRFHPASKAKSEPSLGITTPVKVALISLSISWVAHVISVPNMLISNVARGTQLLDEHRPCTKSPHCQNYRQGQQGITILRFSSQAADEKPNK